MFWRVVIARFLFTLQQHYTTVSDVCVAQAQKLELACDKIWKTPSSALYLLEFICILYYSLLVYDIAGSAIGKYAIVFSAVIWVCGLALAGLTYVGRRRNLQAPGAALELTPRLTDKQEKDVKNPIVREV